MDIKKIRLTNNQLKIIAMIAMLLDHSGKVFFPGIQLFSVIGRLAFPIFSYMIAEGCTYTRDRKKYFLKIAGLALGCQAVYFIAEGSLYQNVLITFSLSLLTIFSIENFVRKKNLLSFIVMATEAIVVIFLCLFLPDLEKGFHIDYGIFGVLLSVVIYFAPNKSIKIIVMALVLICLSFDMGGIQWYSLLSLLLIVLYNAKRGKMNLKYLFYIFYPLHLAVIYLVDLLLTNF